MGNQLAPSIKQKQGMSGSILQWVMGSLCFGLLIFILIDMALQFTTPPPIRRIQVLQDVPLPGPFTDAKHTTGNPLQSGVTERGDHFDFQALDPQSHLLFFTHTGPNPDKDKTIDARSDGNVMVFDTIQKKLVARLNIPQVTGLVAAPDLGKIYAAGRIDNAVYVIDERTLTKTAIPLGNNEKPDSITYDTRDHLVFVADPGAPSDPTGTIINPKNQNISVIDTTTNTVVTKINLGIDKPWGDDIGHIRYDSVSGHILAITFPLSDPRNANSKLSKINYMAVIDPLTQSLVSRVQLPTTCINPHGLVLDTEQREAFIACIDSDPTPSIVRIDLNALKPIVEAFPGTQLKPDILAIDSSLHILYVGCSTGISVFDESNRSLKRISDFMPGMNMHTIATNTNTHEIYAPLLSVGGRSVLRILRYDPHGIV